MTTADFDLACAATALYVYPIKACAALPVDEIELDARGGAVGDREWAIVDAQGAVAWLGTHPRLALVHPRVAHGGLRLTSPGFDDVGTPALAPCRVKIWNDLTAGHDTFDAADAGDGVAAWLERVVGAPLRLVRLGGAALAREGTNALHLVFTASVAAVDAELATMGRPPSDPRRFRPNIVLGMPPGDGAAFVEESLATLEWHGDGRATRLEITAPCVRCVAMNVDPGSASVDEAVLDTLTRLSRQRRDGGTVFGVYARGAAGTRLRVGDSARMGLAF